MTICRHDVSRRSGSARSPPTNLLDGVQGQQSLLLIVLDHPDNKRQEVVEVADGDVSSSKCSSGANFFLLCCESLDSMAEDILLRGHVARRHFQYAMPDDKVSNVHEAAHFAYDE